MGCPNRSNPHKNISTLWNMNISRGAYNILFFNVLLKS
jgi:hypothetical protein